MLIPTTGPGQNAADLINVSPAVETNITDYHREVFGLMQEYSLEGTCLFSCFMDGHPTVAICAVELQDDGDTFIRPLVVFPPIGAVLTDHQGLAA